MAITNIFHIRRWNILLLNYECFIQTTYLLPKYIFQRAASELIPDIEYNIMRHTSEFAPDSRSKKTKCNLISILFNIHTDNKFLIIMYGCIINCILYIPIYWERWASEYRSAVHKKYMCLEGLL